MGLARRGRQTDKGGPVNQSMDAETLAAALHRLIPPARAMEVRVAELTGAGIVLTAPLDANHNHAGTGFAGSLYSLAALAGWGWLYAFTRGCGLEPELLLAEGRMRYHRPYETELRACLTVPPTLAGRLHQRLAGGRRMRARLTVHLPDADAPAATLEGDYAAVP